MVFCYEFRLVTGTLHAPPIPTKPGLLSREGPGGRKDMYKACRCKQKRLVATVEIESRKLNVLWIIPSLPPPPNWKLRLAKQPSQTSARSSCGWARAQEAPACS